MNLETALSNIKPLKGVTTMISALLDGDAGSIQGAFDKASTQTMLSQAEKKHDEYQKLLRDCRSDAAYWGYLGDVEYWASVVDILTAADLLGSENLPDIPAPDLNGMVMDGIAQVRNYGKKIREVAEKIKSLKEGLKK